MENPQAFHQLPPIEKVPKCTKLKIFFEPRLTSALVWSNVSEEMYVRLSIKRYQISTVVFDENTNTRRPNWRVSSRGSDQRVALVPRCSSSPQRLRCSLPRGVDRVARIAVTLKEGSRGGEGEEM